MMLRSLSSIGTLKGTRVLLRVDLNEPKGEGQKLAAILPTLKFLIHRDAKIIVATHLGRPKGEKSAEHSTKRLVAALKEATGVAVKFSEDIVGKHAEAAAAELKPGTILLLENLRFDAGEEKNSKKFAQSLARLADVFVNDAFAVCHRAHASVVGVTEYLPAYAGIRLTEEASALWRVYDEPSKPLAVVLGGAKVSSKIDVIKKFLEKKAIVMIGGAMASTFFAAQGYEIGKSFYEKSELEMARHLLRYKNLHLPYDVVVTEHAAPGARVRMIPPAAIHKHEMIVDVGLTGLCDFRAQLENARTIVWNGPLGIAEIPDFAHGSIMIGRTIAKCTEFGARTLVGGGDTLPVVHMTGMDKSFTYVSTAGGAALEFMTGTMLPGLVPLISQE